jgi:hypothetical protein
LEILPSSKLTQKMIVRYKSKKELNIAIISLSEEYKHHTER